MLVLCTMSLQSQNGEHPSDQHGKSVLHSPGKGGGGPFQPKCLQQDPTLERTLQPPANNHVSDLDKCGSRSRRSTGNAICINARHFMPLETLYLWTHLLVPGHHFLPSSHLTSLLFFYPICQQHAKPPFVWRAAVPSLPLTHQPQDRDTYRSSFSRPRIVVLLRNSLPALPHIQFPCEASSAACCTWLA